MSAIRDSYKQIKNYLKENKIKALVELDEAGPTIVVSIKKKNKMFSSKYLDTHFSGKIFRPSNEGVAKGKLMGDYVLLEEVYDQLEIISQIGKSFEDFEVSVNRTYFYGKFIVYELC